MFNCCCWSILELWSPLLLSSTWTVIHPPSLGSSFTFIFLLPHTQSRGFCLSSSFLLWTWSSFNQLSSSLTLPSPKPPQCIDCLSDLGGSESGAEVRIRNKQLYCNSCYMRFKSECMISKIVLDVLLLLLLFAGFKCNITCFVFFQPASQPLCDMTILQQIDEETTCDNNPWTLKANSDAHCKKLERLVWNWRRWWELYLCFFFSSVWLRGQACKEVISFNVFIS